jgi:hypothetical protein
MTLLEVLRLPFLLSLVAQRKNNDCLKLLHTLVLIKKKEASMTLIRRR